MIRKLKKKKKSNSTSIGGSYEKIKHNALKRGKENGPTFMLGRVVEDRRWRHCQKQVTVLLGQQNKDTNLTFISCYSVHA
jgi:hypothetical protein